MHLIVRDDQGERRLEFPAEQSVVRIGRLPDNDVALAEKKASRAHAELRREGDLVRVVDLGSSNGTRVEGQAISTPVTLAPGQRFSIGASEIVFVELGAPSAPPPKPAHPPAPVSRPALAPAPTVDEGSRLWRLIVRDDAGERRLSFPLGHCVSIGRLPDNDVAISEKKASRKHCELHAAADGWRLKDLGSSNGVWVGQERIGETVLKPGDGFRIGQSTFTIEAPESAAAAVVEPPKPALSPPRAKTKPAPEASPLPEPAPRESWELRLEGPDGARQVALSGAVVTIGRVPECDLAIAEKKASRRHCELRREGAGWRLVDLGSSNGTQVGGEPVEEYLLESGQGFEIGETILRLVDLAAPVRAAATAPAAEPKPAIPPREAPSSGAADDTGELPAALAAYEDPKPTIRAAPKPPDRSPRAAPRHGDADHLRLYIQDARGPWTFTVESRERPITIGREEGNDIVLQEGKASRAHAKIAWQGDHWELKDLQSANGTRVGGEPVVQRRLKYCDEIEIGESRLVFGDREYARAHADEEARPVQFWRRLNSPLIWGPLAAAAVGALGLALYFGQDWLAGVSDPGPAPVTAGAPSSATVAFQLAQAKTGDAFARIRVFEAFIAAYPNSPEAARAKEAVEGLKGTLRDEYDRRLLACAKESGFLEKARYFELARRQWQQFLESFAIPEREAWLSLGISVEQNVTEALTAIERAAGQYFSGLLEEERQAEQLEAPKRFIDRLHLWEDALDRLSGTTYDIQVARRMSAARAEYDAWRTARQAETQAAATVSATEGVGSRTPTTVAPTIEPKALPKVEVAAPAVELLQGELDTADAYARIFRYDDAVKRYQDVLAKWPADASGLRPKTGVQARLSELRLLRALFARLGEAINKGEMSHVKVGAMSPVKAGADEIVFSLEGVDVPKRWAKVSVEERLTLIEGMPRKTVADYQALALLAYEHDRPEAANLALASAYLAANKETRLRDEFCVPLKRRFEGIADSVRIDWYDTAGRFVTEAEADEIREQEAGPEWVKVFKKGWQKKIGSSERRDAEQAFEKLKRLTQRGSELPGKELAPLFEKEVAALYKALQMQADAASLKDLNLLYETRRGAARQIIDDATGYAEGAPGLSKVQRDLDGKLRELHAVWERPAQFLSAEKLALLDDLTKRLDELALRLADIDPDGKFHDRDDLKRKRESSRPDALFALKDHAANAADRRRLQQAELVMKANAERQGDIAAPERDFVRRLNEYRVMMGQEAIAWEPSLVLAARKHAQYLRANDLFASVIEGHPEGARPADRAKTAGFKAGGAIEELLLREASGADDFKALDGLQRKPNEHRQLLGAWKSMGAAPGDERGTFWVVVLGSR